MTLSRKRKPVDIERLLGGMTEKGLLKEDASTGGLNYSLTARGENSAFKLLLKSRNARLFLIQAAMKVTNQSFKAALLETAKFMKAEFQINLFKDVADAVKAGEVKGIEIEDEEGFIKMYEEL